MHVMLAASLVSLSLIAPQHAGAAALTVVTTGSNSANEWPIYIGQKKNFFAEGGISLVTVPASSTAAAIQQIAAGSGEMASGGLTDPIRAIENGAKISIIRIHAQVPPYTLWAKPGIRSFEDLRKKLIIVGGAKDITRIYFDRMVQPNNLKKGDYDFVYAGTTPSRFAALQAGAVDAAILLPPFSFRAEAAGFSLVGRLSDYVKDMPFTGYAINTAWAKANKDTTIAFFKSYQRAVDWFKDPGNRAEAIEILISEAKINRVDAVASYDYLTSIDIFSSKGIVTPESLSTLVKALASEGDLRSPVDPARFVDSEIVELNRLASQ